MPSLGGLVRDVTNLVRALPGAGFAERQYRDLETVVLRELSHRIREATGEHPVVLPSAPPPKPPTPAERLDSLLRTSMDQTPAESHQSLVDVVLRELVPDEARILSALSDGSVYPLVHVNAGAGAVGLMSRRLLSNASSVGRAAGVALPDRVPAYLSHLEHLGLIEVGPEDETLEDEYEILLTDATVRRARNSADGARVRFPRHTVRITELGKEFWSTCRPE